MVKFLAFLAPLLCTSTVAIEVCAFERQWHVGGGAGVAILDESTAGPAFGAHLGYGLNDVFDWNTELLASRHFRDEGATVISLATGVSYKIDVFEWIPYVGLLGGGYVFEGEAGPNGESGFEPGASVFAGLDYLMSREMAVGIQVRQHATMADGIAFPYFNAMLRLEHRWGF